MPPRRAAAASKAKDLVNGDATSAVKPTTKSAAKPVAKPSAKTAAKRKATPDAVNAKAKAPTPSEEAPKPSKKRKSDDDDADEPKTNGVKRAKRKSATPAPAADEETKTPTPIKRKTLAAKAPATKKARAKAIINHAPTARLNVYVFGDGTNGELGLGTVKGGTEVKRPRLNPNLDSEKIGVVAVAVGGMHTAVLTHDNKIMTWGVNDQGALGRDTTWDGGLRDMDDDKSDSDSDSDGETALNPKESNPGEVDLSGLPDDIVWTQLVCTDSATFALTDDGFVYGWGTFRSNEGIFGFSPSILVQHQPLLIDGLKKITKLAVGANHVLALDNKGCVFAWGSGQQNQLGRRILERFLKNSLVPTQFGLPKQMVNVGAGAYHSFAMHKNGKVYSWGLNSFGETGISKELGEGEGGESDVHHPTVIESLDKFGKVISIEGGSHHTVAVTENGELLVWGRLDGFQLGIKIADLPGEDVIKDSHNNPRILTVPTQIPGIHAIHAAAGSDHCVAVSKEGKGYAWGFSTTYQTGLGTDDDVEEATLIDNTAVRGKKLVWAGAGGQFSVIAGLAGQDVPLTNGVNGHA